MKENRFHTFSKQFLLLSSNSRKKNKSFWLNFSVDWIVAALAAIPYLLFTKLNYLDNPLGSGNFIDESAFCAMLDINISPEVCQEFPKPFFCRNLIIVFKLVHFKNKLPTDMLLVSMDSLWTPDHNLLRRDPEMNCKLITLDFSLKWYKDELFLLFNFCTSMQISCKHLFSLKIRGVVK